MSTPPTSATARPHTNAKTIIGTSVGNALEWYDWNVYASFAVYLSSQLFNSDNPQSAFLETMAVFAVGFVARPFGGVVFGWIGDRIGRKHALTLSVVAASGGSLLIAICPTYESVGWLSSALLLVARLIQGLAHGGELPAAQTYLAEQAPREHRGLYSSSIYVSGTCGQLIGLALGLTLQATLSPEAMNAWGWRIPFALGAVLGLVALWIRRHMEESEIFEEQRRKAQEQPKPELSKNVFIEVFKNWPIGLRVIGMTAGLTVSYYIWSVTIASISHKSFGFTEQQGFVAGLIGNIVFCFALPVWGWVSDKWGRKPTMLIGLGGSALLYFPAIGIIATGSFPLLVAAVCTQLILLAGFLSHAPATYAEMFPTAQRTAGFGIPYAVAIAAFGGTAGMVLAAVGNPWIFAGYSVFLLIVSCITISTMKEASGSDLSH
ncbi:MFS transporter [Brevibacterium ravenspurgense]|uniref:Putative proline/betaine transporter n=1 Tax=Brevibacterium ravenspurgense TaxID=479117 RepID=A0A2I1IFR6_9MICO|nr:MFS transporter [Brevibacterium ravenspurgense]PKY69965.1 MFS transporter [Brevibacterium ravenspurgense]